MDEIVASELSRFTLSHEELTYLLDLLGVRPVLAMEGDSLRRLSEEHRQTALRVAGHSLQARGLILVDGPGETAVDSSLLQVLETCAYPQRLMAVYHWASGAGLPALLLAYQRADQVVLHLRPHLMLHELIVAPSTELAVDAVLRFCEIADTGAAHGGELIMTPEDFLSLRSLVEMGDLPAAELLVATKEHHAALAHRILSTMQAAPRVSTVSAAHRNGRGVALQQNMFTVLQSQKESWLLIADESSGQVVVTSCDLSTIRASFRNAF